jgi:uncharacterized protein (TIGR02466 family)
MLTMFKAEIFDRANVGTDEQREKLIKQILRGKDKNENPMGYTNIDCWRGRPNLDMQWLAGEVQTMTDQAVGYYAMRNKVYKEEVKDLRHLSYDYWVNVNEPGSRNMMHSHCAFHYAAIYYLQATDTGCLIMSNPANKLSECNPGSPYTGDVYIDPKDGDLFLWPAWVPHEVDVNKSNKQRINIAFNLTLTEEPNFGYANA